MTWRCLYGIKETLRPFFDDGGIVKFARIIKINRHVFLISAEILAVVSVLFILGIGFLALRLLSGPMDAGFVKPYVLEALKDEKTGVYARMDRMVLQWPELRGPILVEMKNSRFYNAEGKVVVSVDEAAFGLSKRNLMLGQVVPVALILKNPTLRIVRYEDNGFDIELDRGVESKAPPATGLKSGESPLAKIAGWLSSPGKDPDEPAFLRALRSFEIKGAKVIVDDRQLDMSWTVPQLDIRLERREEGVHSKARIRFEEKELQPATLNVEAILENKTGKIGVEAVLEHFGLSLLADRIPELSVLRAHEGILDARLNMLVGADMVLESAKFTLLSAEGAFNIPALSDGPVPFSDMGLAAEYDGLSGNLTVKRGQVTLNENVEMKAEGALNIGKDGFEGDIKFMIDRLRQADIEPVWPVALKGDASEKWIVQNLSDGVFSDVYALVSLNGAWSESGWQVDVGNVSAGFAFEGMTINYRPPLSPVRDANGTGTFDLKSEMLRIDIESASLLDMKIAQADVELVNIIEAGKGNADINIKLAGPLKSALEYVKNEPISVKTEIDVKNVQGLADLRVNLAFPAHAALSVEDVKVNVKGELRDVSLPGVVRDLTLTGGPLALAVEGNVFSVTGSAKLEGRDITLDYQEFLNAKGQDYSSRVKASLVADADLRARMGMELGMFLEGPAAVNVTYTQHEGGKSFADVEADLRETRLFFDPFDYEKKAGAAGNVTLCAVLQNGALKEIRDMKGRATNFLLESSVLSFRSKGAETQLSSGNISRFTLNETVASMKFDVAADGRYDITMNGPFLDFRPFLNDEGEKEGPYANPPLRISIAVDRMRTTDGETLRYSKISADIDAQGVFNRLEMDAIAGKGDLRLRYKPDNTGRRVFRLEAADAGAALKAFSIYDNMIGGRMMIYGEPIGGIYDRNLRGVAEISDFKVVKAPALARLLGAMSLPGVLQLLNNEGLTFSKLEAKFDWRFRQRGSLLTLKDGRTSGNALGLTFDGTFDNAAGTLDVTGTIIPLSGINKIIGSIPLVGDIITGGTGTLIAATYSMKGSMKDPQTSVNPLSVLTPGILRRILFE